VTTVSSLGPDLQAALHAAIVESSDDAIVSSDLNGIVTSWNRGAERVFGYTASEMIGSSVSRLFPPDRVEEERAMQARILQGERVDHLETRKIAKGNRPVDVSVTISPVRDAKGVIVGMSRITRDIGELKARDRDIQRERNFSDAMLNSMPGVLYLYDEAGHFIRWNRRFEELTGRSAAEIDQIHPLDFFDGRERDLVAERIAEVLTKGESSVEASLIAKDGRRTPCLFTGVRVEVEGRTCIIGVGIDISDRKRLEEEQRESEERFRATFEQAAVGISHVDINGKFLRVNNKLCEITGYSREELLQKTFMDLTPPEYQADDAESVRAMLSRTRSSESIEKQYRRRDGSTYWVSIISTLLWDANGAPKYLIAVTADITARRQLEEQFLRSQRMESLGALASGIAHDLNNLLTPVLMGAEMLRLEKDEAMAAKTIGSIESSALRGAELVKQLLSFARGTRGARMTVQLGHVIREMKQFIQSTFPKNIAFKATTPKDLWPVQGDPTQLNQILLNLCVNARDAMPDGGTLTVTARNVDLDQQYAAMQPGVSAGRYLQLETVDTGTGIPPAVIERIFEPFFTTKEAGKGTGLGLSTVREIVRSHGGHITVTSQPGKGTTFRILIPAAPDAKVDLADAKVARPAPRGAGETIMVVESDAAVLDSIVRTLTAHGYQPLVAQDGADAVALYAVHQRTIGAILMDQTTPLIAGPSLARALRRINPDARIIATTGVAGDTDQALEGARETLRKPYSGAQMLLAISRVLARASR